MIVVRCPKCKKLQRTQPMRAVKPRKTCVYCGRSFDVIANLVKRE